MKKNIFLILSFSLFISACYLPADTSGSTNNQQGNYFRVNPNTHLPALPPGFGPTGGPLIKPRDGQYPANYFNSLPSSSIGLPSRS